MQLPPLDSWHTWQRPHVREKKIPGKLDIYTQRIKLWNWCRGEHLEILIWEKKCFLSRNKRIGEQNYKKLKSFSHSKGNIQRREETVHRVGLILAGYSLDRQLISGGSNCRKLSAKTHNLVPRGVNDLSRHFLQENTNTGWREGSVARVFAAQHGGQGLESPSTHKASGIHAYRARVMGEEETIGLLTPNSRFSKRPCLQGIGWRITARDTWCHPLASTLVHRCEHQHTPMCIYHTHKHNILTQKIHLKIHL